MKMVLHQGAVMTKHFMQVQQLHLSSPPLIYSPQETFELYANVLGMPNSSSYWCPWCLVSHKEWQGEPVSYIAEK